MRRFSYNCLSAVILFIVLAPVASAQYPVRQFPIDRHNKFSYYNFGVGYLNLYGFDFFTAKISARRDKLNNYGYYAVVNLGGMRGIFSGSTIEGIHFILPVNTNMNVRFLTGFSASLLRGKSGTGVTPSEIYGGSIEANIGTGIDLFSKNRNLVIESSILMGPGYISFSRLRGSDYEGYYSVLGSGSVSSVYFGGTFYNTLKYRIKGNLYGGLDYSFFWVDSLLSHNVSFSISALY